MLLTPLSSYPARNAAGQLTVSDPIVRFAVANDGTVVAQLALVRKTEGGDYVIAASLNAEPSPAGPIDEVVLDNPQTSTDYSVVLLNGNAAALRVYLESVADPVSLPVGGATSALQTAGNASLASIDGKLSALGPQPKSAAVAITFATDIPPLSVNIGSTVDRSATGSITSTQTVELATAACGTVGIQLSATWTGTVYFEATVNGTDWDALEMTPSGGGALATSATANGSWTAACASFQKVQVRGDVSSGSATGFLNASTASTTVVLGDSLPPGSNAIGSVAVSSSVLPSGASTAALQTTGNTSLASLDSKAPALVSGRIPVDASGVTVTVSGTVTANVGTTNGLALDATLTGGTQKTLLYDGSDTIGTVTHPLRTDPTGTTAQPVTDNAGSITVDSPQLPASLGATTKAGSISVAIATDQVGTAGTAAANVLTVQGIASMTALKVDGSAVAQPVTDNSGSLTIDSAQLPSSLGITTKSASLSVAMASDQVGTAGAASSTVVTVQGVASMTPVQVSQATASALNATVVGAGTAGTPSGGVVSVQGVTSMTPLQVLPPTGTWTLSTVASSASSGTLSASNASRRGLCVSNNSTSILYLYMSSSTATITTANNVLIPPGGDYVMPSPIYTGQITCIWSAANGSAQVTEIT